jgi:phosphomannomutase
MEIKFGTDGWRGVIGYDFTVENVKIVAQAIADYLKENNGEGVAVGYDTRFLSEKFAWEICRVFAANGLKPFLTPESIPTPMLSFAVKSMGLQGGIMVTASHNPPEYNGIKFKGPYGGSATGEIIAKIEGELGTNSPAYCCQERFDPLHIQEEYTKKIRKFIDFDLIREAKLKVIFDPMYGAVRGVIPRILRGVANVMEINNVRNPYFGGNNPEPVFQNLNILRGTVIAQKGDIGLATDGDGDRLGVVDENGNYVNAQQIFALLLKYLVEGKGIRGGVAKTFSTTKMVDLLAEKYGLPVFETPIGFKYICELFLTEKLMMGGEESGGIGFQGHIPERDGILSGLLLLEMVAKYQKPLSEILHELRETIGPHFYKRIDIPVRRGKIDEVIEGLTTNLPKEFAGFMVTDVHNLDGLKFILEDRSWILMRASGTEPIVRIYIEADQREKVEKIAEAGRELF